MKQFKKLIIAVMVFVFTFTLTDIPAITNPVTVQAATVKINKKTLTLEIGKSETLKVTGTSKAVKWSTSNKKVATVSTKGKVTAKTAGKAKITAAVGSQKYICSVTVKASANPYLKDAPFDAQEVPLGNISLVMPTDWDLEYTEQTGGMVVTLTPKDSNSKSYIQMIIGNMGDTELDYDSFKEYVSGVVTEDLLNQTFANSLGDTDFTITNFTQADMDANFGKVCKTSYTLTIGGTAYSQEIYDFMVSGYVVEIATGNFDNTDLAPMIEYVINSIIVK